MAESRFEPKPISHPLTTLFCLSNYKAVGTRDALKGKVARSCPTLCDPMDYTVQGILQARILERATSPFSRGSSQPRDLTQVSCISGGFFTS